MEAPPPRLELRGVTKRFPGVLACDHVDLRVEAGEIHGLIGQNGAGKSTLTKLVYGLLEPDGGHVLWNGAEVAIGSPAAAGRLGIAMVFQHFSLFDSLSVAENVALALDDPGPMSTLPARIVEIARRYGLALDPRRAVHDLSVGERQRVEIVRCLMRAPKLLIMDEPTSVLTPQEAARLFDTLRVLAAEGCAILYISHKLDEIAALCSRATVMRAGRVVGVCDPRAESPRYLAELMIGATLPQARRRAPAGEAGAGPGAVRLEVAHLETRSAAPYAMNIRDASFEVRAGEILGIAGLAGSGQAELLAALSGEARTAPTEAIRIDGRATGALDPAARRALGLAFVPEERLGRGAVPPMTLADNAVLTGWRVRGLTQGGWIDRGAARREADAVIGALDVKARGPDAEAGSLSGGNLQKFIVGREIAQAPGVMIVAQPTWGVDAGAAAAIHQRLFDLATAGAAILVVSQDLDELFLVSDRIAVLCAGRLSPARPTGELTVEEVGLLMGGVFEAA